MTTEKKIISNSETYKIYSEFAINKKIILHHGDSLKFLKTVPNNSINLIVTSPPYNIGKKYEEKEPLEVYLKKQEIIIKELYSKLKSEGSVCWEVGNYVNKGEIYPLDIYFYEIFKNLG
ncbi:unnamed protein product, partial [marine sediment metagenome]